MNFDEAQHAFEARKRQLDSGQITIEQFYAAVAEIRVTDSAGQIWTPDPASGAWLRWNGSSWEAAAAPARPPSQPQVQAAQPPPKPAWSQRIWDVLSIAGGAVMSAAWYWYSSLDAYVTPDYRTCAAMVIMPILLVVFRTRIDGWLRPLEPIRRQIPRMVLLGVGVATPLVIANLLYASGSSNYPYIFKTYLLSTIISYVILRQPPRRMPSGFGAGRTPGVI